MGASEERKKRRDANRKVGRPKYRLRSMVQSRLPALKFLGIFAAVVLGYWAIAASPPFRERFFPAYLEGTAKASAAILNVFGGEVRNNGTLLTSENGGINVARGCDALDPIALFLAAVLAFPAPWRRKLLACLGGTLALALLNLVRVVTLYLASVHWSPRAFEMLHIEIYQPVFVLLAILLFVVWAWRVQPAPSPQHP